MIWVSYHPNFNPDMLGFIPTFLSDEDPRSAREQFDYHYAFAGGWRPQKGFSMDEAGTLTYGDPNDEDADPPLEVLCESVLREERIYFYHHAYVAIVQKNGSFEVCRMD